MYLSASVGALPAVYTAGTAGIYIQMCARTSTGTGTDFRTGTGTDFRTGTGNFGKFGTTSIPVPETSVSSVHTGT